jgi:serine/threonine-protein kinase
LSTTDARLNAACDTPIRYGSDSETPTAVGAQIGRYVVCSKIGSGGMATIYLACETDKHGFRRFVALKRMHPKLACERRFVEMFFDEAHIATALVHPYVARVLDYGKASGWFYIAMEYLAGEPLSNLVGISAPRASSERHIAHVVRAMADFCEALHAAHELHDGDGKFLGVVHRDISPPNLVILYDGTVRLLDFGIARTIGALHHSTPGVLRGKFSYMAPEQLQDGTVDRRTDVWSLGVVLWELLTGQRLFGSASSLDTAIAMVNDRFPLASKHNRLVSPELDAILARAVARDPTERYPTARALGSELLRYLHRRGAPVDHFDVAEWMAELFPRGRGRHEHLLHMAHLICNKTLADRPAEPPPSSAASNENGSLSGRRRSVRVRVSAPDPDPEETTAIEPSLARSSGKMNVAKDLGAKNGLSLLNEETVRIRSASKQATYLERIVAVLTKLCR